MDLKKVLIGIIVIIGIIFLLNMLVNNNNLLVNNDNHDFVPFEADANVTAKESSVNLINSTEATQDKFVAEWEDDKFYHGHWVPGSSSYGVYNVKFKVDLDDIKWNISPRSDEYSDEINETLIKNYINDFLINNLTSVYADYHDVRGNKSNENGWMNLFVDLKPLGFPTSSNLKVENNTLIFDGNFTSVEDISNKDLNCYLMFE